MAKKAKAQSSPSSYELLGQRIQRVINSPRAQAEKCAEISRLPEERQEDWDRLLEELETLEHVTITPMEGEAVRLRWNPEEAL